MSWPRVHVASRRTGRRKTATCPDQQLHGVRRTTVRGYLGQLARSSSATTTISSAPASPH